MKDIEPPLNVSPMPLTSNYILQKAIFNLNENKQALAQHVSNLRQQKESLRVRLEALKVLDEEIIYSVKKRTLKMKSAKHILLMN